MTNTYQHKGVTIDAQGGGIYELSHPALETPERVRGKEVAERRADEIAASVQTDPEGHIDQPDLASIVSEGVTEPAIATVSVTEGAQPERIPASVPRQYTGKLSEAQQQAIGVKFSRIVLEENENIPPTGLYLAHNGRGYMISPGEEVDVPEFLLNVLNDAIMSAPIVDPKTRKVLGYRNRSRYPYRRV